MLDALVDTLAREAGPVSVIETHISAVLLTAQRAYKLKKPVNLGFLDFTRLRQRRHFCREELRLNRRLAPDLYLSVLPITGSVSGPAPGRQRPGHRLRGRNASLPAGGVVRSPARRRAPRRRAHRCARRVHRGLSPAPAAGAGGLALRPSRRSCCKPPATTSPPCATVPVHAAARDWIASPPGPRPNTGAAARCWRGAGSTAGCANVTATCTLATSSGWTASRCRSTASNSTPPCAGRTCTASWPS